jgi:C-terminal processing protease CtpA/Prc
MKWLYLAGLCLLIQACGGGGDEAVDPACAPAQQRLSLRDYMDERYFWYTQLGVPNEGAATVDAYFQSMLYKPVDRYSFTQTAASFNQVFTEGRRVGYGYTLVWADAAQTRLRIRKVEPLSPAARAGLGRGDTVLAIDGLGPAEIAAGALPNVTTPGIPRVFMVVTTGGSVRAITVDSQEYALSPLATKTTFEVSRNGVPVKVGYLAYHQFVGYSTGGLSTAMAQFGAAGVQELILDLRYNGGGSVATSRDLASMIGGSRTANKLYAYLRFNDKQVANNIRVPFNANTEQNPFALPIPQGLGRVIVITSGGTASASELLINGLRPFVDVVLVGGTTYGKPYGFVPKEMCGTVVNAVQFESLNSAGTGNFTQGFTPDCQVPDDLDRQLGDPSERRTRAALDYVVTGRCGGEAPMSARVASPPASDQAFGETVPSQMFAD